MTFKRILLKLSGEALIGAGESIDPIKVAHYANEVFEVANKGLEVAVVIGGGNIFRGKNAETTGIDRVQADYMGMLATLINAMALQSAFEKKGMNTRLMSGIRMEQVCEPFIKRRAIRHLEKGRIIIFGAGTGNPYFTTDTTASLRASEIGANVILKGTRVDGVYSKDPEKYPDAEKYDVLTFNEAYEKGLEIMDKTAFTMCQENDIPIIVFDMNEKNNLIKIINGASIGTLIK